MIKWNITLICSIWFNLWISNSAVWPTTHMIKDFLTKLRQLLTGKWLLGAVFLRWKKNDQTLTCNRSKNALERSVNLSVTLRQITVTAERSALNQACLSIKSLCGCFFSLTDAFVHHCVTWSLSSCAALRFPHWSLVLVTKARFSSWDRDIHKEISCQPFISQRFTPKGVSVRWPICMALPAGEGDGHRYLVTVINVCCWSEWRTNAMSHNSTIVCACLWWIKA